MIRVNVRNEYNLGIHDYSVNMLKTEVIVQLVVGTLATVQKYAMVLHHLQVYTANIAILARLHGPSAQKYHMRVYFLEAIAVLWHRRLQLNLAHLPGYQILPLRLVSLPKLPQGPIPLTLPGRQHQLITPPIAHHITARKHFLQQPGPAHLQINLLVMLMQNIRHAGRIVPMHGGD